MGGRELPYPPPSMAWCVEGTTLICAPCLLDPEVAVANSPPGLLLSVPLSPLLKGFADFIKTATEKHGNSSIFIINGAS
jgi:hypothetical protein